LPRKKILLRIGVSLLATKKQNEHIYSVFKQPYDKKGRY